MTNRNIFSVMSYRHGHDTPAWKHPRMNNTYVKQLNFCDTHPNCTGKDLSAIGSADMWKTLVNWGMIDLVMRPGSKRSYTLVITSSGKELLEKAKASKWVFDFIDYVKSTDSKSLEELDLNAAVCGCHHYLEQEFLAKIADVYWNQKKGDNMYLLNQLKKNIKFFDELLDLWVSNQHKSSNESLIRGEN